MTYGTVDRFGDYETLHDLTLPRAVERTWEGSRIATHPWLTVAVNTELSAELFARQER